MIDRDELRVPRALRLVADEIVAITDAACRAVLDEEYADLARPAVAKLARKRPSPLTAGRRATWAAGVVYALGQANFVFDPAGKPLDPAVDGDVVEGDAALGQRNSGRPSGPGLGNQ